MKNIAIEITSKTGKDKLAVLELIQKFSKESVSFPFNVYASLKDFAFSEPKVFPVVVIDNNRVTGSTVEGKLYITASKHFKYPQDTTDIINYLMNPKQPVTVKVGEYTAEIDDTGIKVGCTHVSYEKLAEINDAVKKYNEQ